MRTLLTAATLIATACCASAQLVVPYPPHIRGYADVVDGDTIKVEGKRVRLYGIDAPELNQLCDDALTGFHARYWLYGLLHGGANHGKVDCIEKAVDRYGRSVAVCWSETKVDLGQMMVRDGYAFAYTQYSHDYVEDELIARAADGVVHSQHCEKPWVWRRSHPNHY